MVNPCYSVPFPVPEDSWTASGMTACHLCPCQVSQPHPPPPLAFSHLAVALPSCHLGFQDGLVRNLEETDVLADLLYCLRMSL